MTPVEFRGDLCQQKNRVPGLSCGVVCVILCLAVLVELRLVTDRRTDGRTQGHGLWVRLNLSRQLCGVKRLPAYIERQSINAMRWEAGRRRVKQIAGGGVNFSAAGR